jgi:hypothetical protein
MTTPKLPELLAKCEDCDWEGNCHPPESVAWSPKRQKWLCDECWTEDRDYDEVKDEYEYERPLVYAKDALDDREDMLRRLIAAATARRMGV